MIGSELRLFRFFLFVLVYLGLQGCSPDPAGQPGAFPHVDFPGTPTLANGSSVSTTPAVSTSQAVTTPAVGNPLDMGFLIIYEKSGSLWVSSAGDRTQLTAGSKDSHPKISADGKLVVFLRDAELWAVEITGSALRKVYGEAGASPLQYEFAARTHDVYFTTSGLDGKPRFDLKIANLDNGSLTELLPVGLGGRFTASPDWQVMALVQPGKISTFKMGGAGAKVVYQFSQIQGPDGIYFPQVAWMENGFGFKTVIPGLNGKPTRFIFIPAAGGEPAILAEFSPLPPTISDCYISPDGSRVLYLKEKGENFELHVIDAGTADRAYLNKPRGKMGILGWTPDSKYMIFWLDEPGRIWMTDGKTASALADSLPVQHLAWGNAQFFFFLNDTELRSQSFGQSSQVIDTGVTGDSFVAIRQ